MADDVTLSAGTADGAKVATDDDGTRHHPYVKLEFGADNTYTKVADAAPLPIKITDGTDVALVSAGGALLTDASATTQPVSNAGLTELAAAINVSSQMDVNIAASAATVTVAGTVDLGATDNAVLDAIAASVAAIDTDATTIIGHVDGIETLLGTIDTDTGSILTAVQLIDDSAVVLGTATYTEATSAGLAIGAVRRDADTTLVNTTNEWAPLQVDANGRLKVEAFSGETLPVSLTSTTVTGTVAVTQSGTWDEVGINDSGNSITVDYATTGSGTATGALRVELPTNGTGTVGLNAGTNAIGKLAANSGVDIGDVDVTSISAGTNTIGNVGLIGRTSGGMTIFNSIDLDESEEEIKSSAGQVFSIAAFNHTNAALYLRFYNATAANTTVGTTAALAGPFTVPGNNDTDGAGFIWNNEIGIAFSTAISAAVTTGIAAADTGAPAGNACSVVVGYV